MNAERSESGWPPAAVQILSYLTRHPEAADTLEGIAEWWILRETIEHGVRETAAALDFLVSQNFVLQEWTAEDRPRYWLNRERLDEIRELMGSGEWQRRVS